MDLSTGTQIDWLKQQIELMDTWLHELQTRDNVEPAEIEKVTQHLTWLRENLAKAG